MKEKNIVDEYCIDEILKLKSEIMYLKGLELQLVRVTRELEKKVKLLNELRKK